MRESSTKYGPSESHCRDRSKSRSKKKIKCYKYGKNDTLRKSVEVIKREKEC